MENTVRFYITQYFDGNLEIECKHMHYAFRDGFNFDDFPKEELFDRITKISEHCSAENITPIFAIQ